MMHGETDTLARLQSEQVPWVKHNFGDRPSWMPLLGAQEELGELAHAHLKAAQGIRTGEDHAAAKSDALADVVIYLADYASAEGIDLRAVVSETWDRVKQRDWKANPENGAGVPDTADCTSCDPFGEEREGRQIDPDDWHTYVGDCDDDDYGCCVPAGVVRALASSCDRMRERVDELEAALAEESKLRSEHARLNEVWEQLGSDVREIVGAQQGKSLTDAVSRVVKQRDDLLRSNDWANRALSAETALSEREAFLEDGIGKVLDGNEDGHYTWYEPTAAVTVEAKYVKKRVAELEAEERIAHLEAELADGNRLHAQLSDKHAETCGHLEAAQRKVEELERERAGLFVLPTDESLKGRSTFVKVLRRMADGLDGNSNFGIAVTITRRLADAIERGTEGGEGVWVTPAQIRRVGDHLAADVDWLMCDCDRCERLRKALSCLGIPMDRLVRAAGKGEGDAQTAGS